MLSLRPQAKFEHAGSRASIGGTFAGFGGNYSPSGEVVRTIALPASLNDALDIIKYIDHCISGKQIVVVIDEMERISNVDEKDKFAEFIKNLSTVTENIQWGYALHSSDTICCGWLMGEYPRTVLEFRDWFADNAACRDYLAKLRWPEGFRCPICSEPDHWVTARGLRHCQGCGRQTSVTAGTLFADTHLPLRLWFEALWHVTSQKGGASALGLQRVLGLGAIARRGICCTSCAGRWFAPDATGCKVLSKSMRFSSAGRDQASEGAGAGQSAGRDCSTTGGQRDRPHPADARGRRFGQQSGAGDRRRHRTRQPGTDRRLEGLQRAGSAGVSAGSPAPVPRWARTSATGQPGGVAIEAMAAGHAPRSG